MPDESINCRTAEAEPNGISAPVRIVILEDRPEDAELMAHELRRSWFDPAWVRLETEAQFLNALKSPPDVILADYRMPRLDAPRALELLHGMGLDIPFIVVSGAMGEEAAVSMMRQGATDYLLKDRLRRLGPSVRRALAEKRMREEKRQAEQALRASEARFYSFMNAQPGAGLYQRPRWPDSVHEQHLRTGVGYECGALRGQAGLRTPATGRGRAAASRRSLRARERPTIAYY